MFDKIAMLDNKIRLARYIIEWQEGTPSEKQSQWAFDEAEKDCIKASLNERGIECQVKTVSIPPELLRYDGEIFEKGRDEAVLYVNGIGEYAPAKIRIAELKDNLNAYDKKVAQHERCHRLGLPCKHDIATLDDQAEAWVAEINELEKEVNQL